MSKKGNLLIGQSGGATAVINSSLAGAISEALTNDKVGEIYGMLEGVQGLLNERIVDLRAQVGTPAALEHLKRTPSAALGMCRLKLGEAETERVLKILQKHNIRYFIYIGGNDSADTCHRLAMLAKAEGYALFAIGIPKTIDNDLPDMDHCPGYGSIARYIAQATRDTTIDTAAAAVVHPVKLLEVMGRNAGWVAASAAMARVREDDPPHLIYTPERGLNPDDFLRDVKRTYALYGYCVAVIGETVKDQYGKPLSGRGEPYFVDSFGHRYYQGPASYLTGLVMKELGLTSRFDKPGTLQRMSMNCVSEVDLEEAWLVGTEGVRLAISEQSDLMVTIQRVNAPNEEYAITTGTTPLLNVAHSERKMPADYINSAGNNVTQAFLDYAKPLIGSPILDYFHFDKTRLVAKK
ncbi:6-phosphofructokinase [Candidatus Chlorohelix sp.]|uniref:6-phosphofructokinase n=1 Tax=Candidatus Chlorohelix sp. TaxID=3139201 RepID=UPI003064B7B5